MRDVSSLAMAICLAMAVGGVPMPGVARPADSATERPSIAARPAGFVDRHGALIVSLASVRALDPAPSRDEAEVGMLLDLAEQYLEVAFVREGQSIVVALADAPLRSRQSARRGALRAAFVSLDEPAAFPAPPPPPLRALGDLPGAKAIHAHALVGSGRGARALTLLADDVGAVDETPPALRARVLPGLLEAAVVAGQPGLAAALHDRLLGVAHFSEPGAIAYLTARQALAGGDEAGAAVHLVAAAATDTIWGHRARLDEIDIGRASETLDIPAALQKLAGARTRWRGDEASLGTLRRIAALAIKTKDPLGAAEALGEIWWRGGRAAHDGSRVLEALGAFYAAGGSGALALHDFMEGHRHVAERFRLLPGYDVLSEGFADHLLSRGATDMAAAEYAAVRAHLEFGAERGLWPPLPSRHDALRLKEAGAHLAGGRLDAARALLRDPLRAATARDAARLGELRTHPLMLAGDAPAADPGPPAGAERPPAAWSPAADERAPRGDPGALGVARLRSALDRADDVLRASTETAKDAPADPAGDRGDINTSLTGGP